MQNKTQKRNENIIKFRNKGLSYRKIARIFKLSHTQIRNVVKAYLREREVK